MKRQPMIPGLDWRSLAKPKPKEAPLSLLLRRVDDLESRMLALEMEISLLRIQMEKERQ